MDINFDDQEKRSYKNAWENAENPKSKRKIPIIINTFLDGNVLIKKIPFALWSLFPKCTQEIPVSEVNSFLQLSANFHWDSSRIKAKKYCYE